MREAIIILLVNPFFRQFFRMHLIYLINYIHNNIINSTILHIF
jgi:hypothetical protein